MIITLCIYFECIPLKIGSMQIYFFNDMLIFYRTKMLDLLGSLSSAKFSKLFRYSYRYTLFYFTNSETPPLNSSDEYLKTLSHKTLTNLFRLEPISCMLSIKNKFLLIVKAMYFSNPFSTTFDFTSNLFIYCMIK